MTLEEFKRLCESATPVKGLSKWYLLPEQARFYAASREMVPRLIKVAEAVARLQGGRWIASHDMVLSLVIEGDERDQLWDAMQQLEALSSATPRGVGDEGVLL